MVNHKVLSAALQKYYSALKSLDKFGSHGNFFDDVSSLDTFFSEFRNVTFVIQKELKTEDHKEVYSKLRNEYLSNDTLKWFVETRNKTTKERPFRLKKELKIDIYSPYGTYSLEDKRLIVDFDSSLADALKILEQIFLEELQWMEVFFSARIMFSEEEESTDLYPKIRAGITQMNNFILRLQQYFPCECEVCSTLKMLGEKLYQAVMFKELTFVNDYSFDKKLTKGDKVEMYFPAGESNYVAISSIRTTLDNELYKDANGCLFKLFKLFASYHVAIYRAQDNNIMPVFMIVFSDYTYQTIPFIATTKATFYRKAQELADTTDFGDVLAVLYCGEYYTYDTSQLSVINQMSYSERTNRARNEILSFTMLAEGGYEIMLSFDESRINDTQYVAEKIRAANWNKGDLAAGLDGLGPIRQKMNTRYEKRR